MRGRKPTPSYMRVLEGSRSKNGPKNHDEPKPEEKLEDFEAPAHLTAEQQRIWRGALKGAPPGMLTTLDASTLEVWVVAHSVHRDAQKKVAALGSLLKGKSGTPYQNPYLSIMNKQAQIMLKAAAEMGFTPSSRSRVKVPPRKPGTANPFGDLKTITDE